MRKRVLLLSLMFLVATLVSFAEKKAPKNKNSAVGNNKWSLGIGMETADFYSPKLKEVKTFKVPMSFGPRIGFWRNFNSSIALGVDFASYVFSTKNEDVTLPALNTYNLLYAGTAVYKFNNGYILREDAAIAPYIFAKLQGTWAQAAVDKSNLNGFGIPIGAGINWKIANNVSLNTYGGYNFAVKNNDDHIFFGAGIMADLGKGKEIEEEPVAEQPAVLLDTDGDGIADIDDACPSVPGVAQFNGCPDTDGDGIADKDDECPTAAGIVEFNGCPDTDGDGIADYKDACPKVKGVAQFGGCPNPDSDGDGIVDEKDKCPTVYGNITAYGCPDKDGDGIIDNEDECPNEPGVVSAKGCPLNKVVESLNLDLKNVQFDVNKATIRPESYAILDKAAKTMNEKLPNSTFYIDGHTDTRGSATANKTLSTNRAKEVVKYLVGKGVDASRLTARGFGEEQPKCKEDGTEANYFCNRRVELVFKNGGK